MTNSLKRFGGVLSIVALLVVLAWTPGEAGFGGIQRMVSTPTSSSADLVPQSAADSGDSSLPWYFFMLQPVLNFTMIW